MQIDMVRELPPICGYQNIVAAQDVFLRNLHIPTRNQDTQRVARNFIRNQYKARKLADNYYQWQGISFCVPRDQESNRF